MQFYYQTEKYKPQTLKFFFDHIIIIIFFTKLYNVLKIEG